MLITAFAVVVLSPDALILRLLEADRWTVIFWRGLFMGSTLLLVLAMVYGRLLPGMIRVMGGAGLLAASIFTVSIICFVSAISLTSAANVLVIIAASPLFSALFTRIFLKESVPVRTWVAVVFGFAGIVLIFAGSLGGGTLLGDLLAAATAMLLGAEFVTLRYARGVNMLPSMAMSGLMVACVVLPWAAPASVSSHDFGLLILLGVFILPTAFGLITLAPKHIPAAEVSLIMLLETVLGPIWVWWFLSEVPTKETLIGGAVILSTLAAHSLWGLQQYRKNSRRRIDDVSV